MYFKIEESDFGGFNLYMDQDIVFHSTSPLALFRFICLIEGWYK